MKKYFGPSLALGIAGLISGEYCMAYGYRIFGVCSSFLFFT